MNKEIIKLSKISKKFAGNNKDITVLATIFPSLSAAKLDPVKALKYE